MYLYLSRPQTPPSHGGARGRGKIPRERAGSGHETRSRLALSTRASLLEKEKSSLGCFNAINPVSRIE